MEPTIAPMMMLVTVIPKTEEERGAESVLIRRPSLVLSVTQTRGSSQTTNRLDQDTSISRRRVQGEEGRKKVGIVTLLPRQRDSEEERWALIQGNGKNIQKKLTEMS